MQRHLRPWEDETVEPEPRWAHASELSVDLILATLHRHEDTSLDGEAIEISRRTLITSCDKLARCLYDIHAFQSTGFGGFEEPPKSEESAYKARAALACGQIEELLSQVVKSANTLDTAFDSRLSDVRRELRRLERLVF